MWLSKPPGERLLQFIRDNEVMFNAFEEAKVKLNIKQKEASIIATGKINKKPHTKYNPSPLY